MRWRDSVSASPVMNPTQAGEGGSGRNCWRRQAAKFFMCCVSETCGNASRLAGNLICSKRRKREGRSSEFASPSPLLEMALSRVMGRRGNGSFQTASERTVQYVSTQSLLLSRPRGYSVTAPYEITRPNILPRLRRRVYSANPSPSAAPLTPLPLIKGLLPVRLRGLIH